MLQINVLAALNMQLGECPRWNESEQSWYWVDILGKALYRFETKVNHLSSQSFDFQPAFFAFTKSNQIIMTSSSGVYLLNSFKALPVLLLAPERHLPSNRFNDGVVTANGDFLAGTIGDGITATGTLYHFDLSDRTFSYKTVMSGFKIINGQAFSPDGKWLYITDTPEQKILKYPFNSTTKAFGSAQLFHQFTQDDEYPDGAAVDSEGNYWIAMYGSGKICVINPQGGLINEIYLPISQPTMVAFGGSQLNKLLVTSAAQGLTKKQLEKEPLAGSTLILDVNYRGITAKNLNNVDVNS